MGVKIAVVGGGSTYTPELIEGFHTRRDRLPVDELVLNAVELVIETASLTSGSPDRDEHLKSRDWLDVEHFPWITFRSTGVAVLGGHDFRLTGELSIRGVTRPATLAVHYLGQWTTPWWEDGADRGPKTRAGFLATTSINRHDFGVSWNSLLDRGGIVVGDTVEITIDAEAILEAEK